MKSLAHAPQLDHTLVDETSELDGETYQYSIRVLSFSETGNLFDGEPNQHQNSKVLSSLIVFQDEEGNVVPLSYDAARKLPSKLGGDILKKALAANGFGEAAAKN